MPIERALNFTPVVHSRAWLHPTAVLMGDVHLAEDVSVWPYVVLRGDSGRIQIGARTNVQDATVGHATSGVSTTTVGEDCTIGHRVLLHGCTVGNRCLVGMGSILLDGAELGDDSFLAAGSLLPPGKKFPPKSFLVGSPAKLVRQVTPQDQENIRKGCESYLALLAQYRG